MAQALDPNQIPIGTLPNQATAETMLENLKNDGFPVDSIMLLAESPTIPETKARDSGGKGAIVGALLGGFLGLFLSSSKIFFTPDILPVHPIANLIGMFLAGSLMGAFGIGIIAAMTGVNVLKDSEGGEAVAFAPDILVIANNLPANQLQQLRDSLKEHHGVVKSSR